MRFQSTALPPNLPAQSFLVLSAIVCINLLAPAGVRAAEGWHEPCGQGQTLDLNDKFQQALAKYDEALKLVPEHDINAKIEVQSLIACDRLQLKNFSQAAIDSTTTAKSITSLRQRLSPEALLNAQCLVQRWDKVDTDILTLQGKPRDETRKLKFQSTLILLKAFNQQDPSIPWRSDCLAECLVRLNNPVAAEKVLMQTIQQHGFEKHPELRTHLAALQARSGPNQLFDQVTGDLKKDTNEADAMLKIADAQNWANDRIGARKTALKGLAAIATADKKAPTNKVHIEAMLNVIIATTYMEGPEAETHYRKALELLKPLRHSKAYFKEAKWVALDFAAWLNRHGRKKEGLAVELDARNDGAVGREQLDFFVTDKERDLLSKQGH